MSCAPVGSTFHGPISNTLQSAEQLAPVSSCCLYCEIWQSEHSARQRCRHRMQARRRLDRKKRIYFSYLFFRWGYLFCGNQDCVSGMVIRWQASWPICMCFWWTLANCSKMTKISRLLLLLHTRRGLGHEQPAPLSPAEGWYALTYSRLNTTFILAPTSCGDIRASV